MKRSEMERHFNCLQDYCTTIAMMLKQRPMDLAVFDHCVESFKHTIPALQYQIKKTVDGEPFSVVPYRTIQLLGPAFFAHNAIEAMCKHINANRYLKRPEFTFTQMVDGIEAREQDAIALWSWIERNPGGEQRLLWQETGVDRASGINSVDLWVESGILERVPAGATYRLTFASDLSSATIGMCPNCGVKGKARREVLYKSRVCQKCGAEVFYHLIQAIEA